MIGDKNFPTMGVFKNEEALYMIRNIYGLGYQIRDIEGKKWLITDNLTFMCLENGKRASELEGTYVNVKEELEDIIKCFKPVRDTEKAYRYNKLLLANGFEPFNWIGELDMNQETALEILDLEGLTMGEIINNYKVGDVFIRGGEVYRLFDDALFNKEDIICNEILGWKEL